MAEKFKFDKSFVAENMVDEITQQKQFSYD